MIPFLFVLFAGRFLPKDALLRTERIFYMELLEGIRSRRSIRRYEERPVDRELLKQVVADAACAPSWKNTQIARYHIVDNPDLKAKIAAQTVLGFTYNTKTIDRAPVLVLLSYKTGLSGYEKDGSYSTPKKDGWEMFDAGIAAQTFCLAAHAHGLGSVIMGIFDEAVVRTLLPLPEDERLGALIAVGWPAEDPSARPRKTADELLSFADGV